MASDDFVIDLSEDEIKALEAPYASHAEPGLDPAPVAKAPEASAKAEPPQPKEKPKSEAAPKTDDPDLWKRRLQEANEREAAERARRIAAEKTVHERSTSLAVTEARATEADYYAVSNALGRTESEIAGLKRAHKEALEAGDYDAATEAADKLAEARTRYSDLKAGEGELRTRLEQAKDRAKKAVEAKPESGNSDGNDFDAFLSQFGPREQQWFRDHPECAPMRDPKLFAKAQAAHYAAVADDVKPGTDQYFEYIDRKMGFREDAAPDKQGDDGVVVSTDSKPAAPQSKRVAAPVSRDGAVVTQRDDGRYQVRLTAEQREVAEAMGMTPTAYAKQLIRARNQGLISA